MNDREIQAALDRHWAASDASDFACEHEIYQEDAVLEYPQSGERIRGRANIQASRTAQPSLKRFAVRRIIGAGELWVTEFVLTYDGQPTYTVSIMEFLEGKVARETQYFGTAFDPGALAGAMGRTHGLKLATAAMASHRPLARSDLPADTASLARYLIGKMVVRDLPEGIGSGLIVETEAYTIGDAAGHAFRGITPRNRSLFLERGHAYIYLAYGTSYMLNVASETEGVGAGVLIRALEPLDGIPIMRLNRGVDRLRDLARGPGRLAKALRIDRRLDGLDLCREGPLWLGRGEDEPGEIAQSIRIGISRNASCLLRFLSSQQSVREWPQIAEGQNWLGPLGRGIRGLPTHDSLTALPRRKQRRLARRAFGHNGAIAGN